MLVKIDNCGAINMLGIDKVLIDTKENVTHPNPTLFSKGQPVTKTTYELWIHYTNADGAKDRLTVTYDNYQKVQNAHKEILNQVKEIENVGATQALEEALKDG
jgi:hypothetical protein